MDSFAKDAAALKVQLAEVRGRANRSATGASGGAGGAASGGGGARGGGGGGGGGGSGDTAVVALQERLQKKLFSFNNVRDIVERQKTIPGFWTEPTAVYLRTAARARELEGTIQQIRGAAQTGGGGGGR
jgi:hypothetical protein